MRTVRSISLLCRKSEKRRSLRSAARYCFRYSDTARIYQKEAGDLAEQISDLRQRTRCTCPYGAAATCSQHLYRAHTALLSELRALYSGFTQRYCLDTFPSVPQQPARAGIPTWMCPFTSRRCFCCIVVGNHARMQQSTTERRA